MIVPEYDLPVKPISISNAQKRLEKALWMLDDVYLRLSSGHFDELQEALGAAKDFTENAVHRCKKIRGAQP